MNNTIGITKAAILFALTIAIAPAQDLRDFSGAWKLNPERSELQSLPTPPDPFLRVDQNGTSMRVFASKQEGGSSVPLTYPLDGKPAKGGSGDMLTNTLVKWEGDALLVNTLVRGVRDYTVMERWKRSRDGNRLTIARTIVSLGGERESLLVYEKPGYENPGAVALATRVQPTEPAPPPVRIDMRESAPMFSGKTLDGERFSKDALKGKVVLLQFWATWCGYCRRDQSMVDDVAQDFANDGLVVLAVNVGESKRKVKQYLQASPRSCKVVLTEDTNLAAVFAARSFPFYVLLDRDGKIVATQRGSSSERGLQGMLSKAGL